MPAFFQKEIPQTPVHLSNGMPVKFEDVDGRVGAYKTTNDFVIGELRMAIAAQRGGVSEITEDEFTELLKKKQPSQPKWRDEIKAGYAPDSLSPKVPGVVAPVANPSAGSAPVKPEAQPLTVADVPKQKTAKFKPKAK